MRIAILGATSQIAKDLVQSFSKQGEAGLVLYARRPEAVTQWLADIGLPDRYPAFPLDAFGTNEYFDAIINFVGSGNPARTLAMGASIFDVTLEYDMMVLNYLHQHPECKYLFLSSGAIYGAAFDKPVNESSNALVAINNLQPQDWYAVAKLYAECRHRALPHLPIVDIRVFNYFSSSQDIAARFLMSDILRAIRHGEILKTSPAYIVRDFLHPSDFFRLVSALLSAPSTNAAVDCYSRAPIDKHALLAKMQEEFGLRYEISGAAAGVNATGIKPYYYSLNTRASEFGYQPELTSIEGILQESKKILDVSFSKHARQTGGAS